MRRHRSPPRCSPPPGAGGGSAIGGHGTHYSPSQVTLRCWPAPRRALRCGPAVTAGDQHGSRGVKARRLPAGPGDRVRGDPVASSPGHPGHRVSRPKLAALSLNSPTRWMLSERDHSGKDAPDLSATSLGITPGGSSGPALGHTIMSVTVISLGLMSATVHARRVAIMRDSVADLRAWRPADEPASPRGCGPALTQEPERVVPAFRTSAASGPQHPAERGAGFARLRGLARTSTAARDHDRPLVS